MADPTALARAIERTLTGPAWHGPALQEILNDLTPTSAFAHPIEGAHSICELVLHTAAWAEIVHGRLRGDRRTDVTPEASFPAVMGCGETDWTAAQKRLAESHEELARLVGTMSDTDLAQQIDTSDGRATAEIMLRGVIEHSAYHGGQMSLLKRALA